MINLLVLALFAIFASIHAFFKRKVLRKGDLLDLYLIYSLVGGVGVIGAIGFVGHLFFADQVARLIGWPTGSPFQFEVGCQDGAFALLGFLCLYFRGNFWIATGIGWSFFLLGATYGHIKQMLLLGDYAPYNAGIIFPDFLVPVILLTLLWSCCINKIFLNFPPEEAAL